MLPVKNSMEREKSQHIVGLKLTTSLGLCTTDVLQPLTFIVNRCKMEEWIKKSKITENCTFYRDRTNEVTVRRDRR